MLLPSVRFSRDQNCILAVQHLGCAPGCWQEPAVPPIFPSLGQEPQIPPQGPRGRHCREEGAGLGDEAVLGQRQGWGAREVVQEWARGGVGSPEAGHCRSWESLSWVRLTQWGCGPGSHMQLIQRPRFPGHCGCSLPQLCAFDKTLQITWPSQAAREVSGTWSKCGSRRRAAA